MTWRQFVMLGILAAVAVALAVLLRKTRVPLAVRFGVLFLLISGSVAVSGYWLGTYIVPQPFRYHLVAEMAAAVALVFGSGAIVHRWLPRYRKVALAVVSVLAVIQFVNYRSYARDLVQPIEIEGTIEYITAQWLGENLPDDRVFALGSIGFWMNAFVGVEQVGGGFAQGMPNPTIPGFLFGIPFTENDGERSAMWLRVYGVDAIVVSGPNTRDSYPAFRDPGKFEGVLRELWRDGDDVIYAVPRRSRSLAHVIGEGDAPSRAPINVTDVAAVEAYRAALENPALPVAAFQWQSPSAALVETELPAGHVVSVQVAYHPGWQAVVDGRPVPIRVDGLGFMVINPGCLGACTIQLSFDG